jgi:hypothetical protein
MPLIALRELEVQETTTKCFSAFCFFCLLERRLNKKDKKLAETL